MPLFLIRREVAGASFEEVEAGGYRALTCAYNYAGLKWVSSYWDEQGGRTYCIYEAESIEQLRDHSERSRIPCDEVIPVREFGPGSYVDLDVSTTSEAGRV